MSWITSGKLDAVLDIQLPRHPDDEVDLKAIFEEITRNVADITSNPMGPEEDAVAAQVQAAAKRDKEVIPGQHRLQRPALRAPEPVDHEDAGKEERRIVTVDIDLRFRDLKAAVPMFTSDLSVRNNAFIRPIVAFIKLVVALRKMLINPSANRTLVPIHCKVEADLVRDASCCQEETRSNVNRMTLTVHGRFSRVSPVPPTAVLSLMTAAGLMTSVSDQVSCPALPCDNPLR